VPFEPPASPLCYDPAMETPENAEAESLRSSKQELRILGSLADHLPDKARLVLKGDRRAGKPGFVARTSANFTYRPGRPGFTLCGYDSKGQPNDVKARVDSPDWSATRASRVSAGLSCALAKWRTCSQRRRALIAGARTRSRFERRPN
jgi:hypothetical protein